MVILLALLIFLLQILTIEAHEIKQNEGISLVLICETGSQSANAGEKLQNLGHKDTLILSGELIIGEWIICL